MVNIITVTMIKVIMEMIIPLALYPSRPPDQYTTVRDSSRRTYTNHDRYRYTYDDVDDNGNDNDNAPGSCLLLYPSRPSDQYTTVRASPGTHTLTMIIILLHL